MSISKSISCIKLHKGYTHEGIDYHDTLSSKREKQDETKRFCCIHYIREISSVFIIHEGVNEFEYQGGNQGEKSRIVMIQY